MKKILLSLSLILTGLLSAETVDIFFIPEGVLTTTQSTTQIVTDPFNSTNQSVTATSETSSLSAGAETEVSKYAKSLTLPLAYSWKNYSASLSVPYFFERTMHYSVGDKTTSGLGDISLGIGYSGDFDTRDSYLLNLLLKLPTGDDKKMADGFLVPLGTGTVDYSASLLMTRKYEDYFFRFKISGRLNSVAKKCAEICYADQDNIAGTKYIETINYDIKNGNSVKLLLGCDYNVWSRLDILSALDLAIYGDGTTELTKTYSWNRPAVSQPSMPNRQELIMADLNLGAKYTLALWEVGTYLSIPVYTQREVDNNEEERSIGFKLKFDYKFF